MKITIELASGNGHSGPMYKEDIQKNIDELNYVINNLRMPELTTRQSLLDTRTILEGIQNQLSSKGFL